MAELQWVAYCFTLNFCEDFKFYLIILVINGIVFFPVNFQESQKILEKAIFEHNGNSKQQINNELVLINATEAAKADGALTCSCVLYQ